MIDFGKVATNALSMLVGAVFVGAAAIVWNAATTVDDRIEKASAGLESYPRDPRERGSGNHGKFRSNRKHGRWLRTTDKSATWR